jgi:phosphorylated adapter RNA export protein
MERGESILDAVLDDEETLDFDGDDVEMADADAVTEEIPVPDAPAAVVGGDGGAAQPEKGGPEAKKKKKKNSGRKKNRGRPDGPPTKIADINR